MEGRTHPTAPAWLADAVFYEVYVQSFCDANGDGVGDIEGIIRKLDYIQSLGCTALWVSPCFVSPFRDGGYDVADYLRVAPRYGTNDDLVRLFAATHARGMHVLLDLVAGHTSDQHPWFQESSQPVPNAYANRYIWTDSVWHAPRDLRCECGRADRDGNYVVNFFSTQPALNYGVAHVTEAWQLPWTHPDCLATRAAVKEVMRFWLEQGCDGFRVDMADSLVKNDDDKKATQEVWRDLAGMVRREYPEAVLVSEWSNPWQALACGFHADFYLDHENNGYHALLRRRDPATGRPLAFFSKRGDGGVRFFVEDYMRRYEAARGHGYVSFITGNHDTPRLARTLAPEELKLAYTVIFTMPGVPFLYYGDEIGMRYVEGLVSKEGGYDRTGSRTPMQWAPGPNLGFSDAPADSLYLPVDASPDAPTVAQQQMDSDSVLSTVARLLRLRHSLADLQADGPFAVVHAQDGCPLVYRRGSVTVAVNPSGSEAATPADLRGHVLFLIGDAPVRAGEAMLMAPQSAVVVQA